MRKSLKMPHNLALLCSVVMQSSFLVYKVQQKWSDWLEEAPPETRIAVTTSGWMEAETFDEWFEYQVLPVLKKQTRKKGNNRG